MPHRFAVMEGSSNHSTSELKIRSQRHAFRHEANPQSRRPQPTSSGANTERAAHIDSRGQAALYREVVKAPTDQPSSITLNERPDAIIDEPHRSVDRRC